MKKIFIAVMILFTVCFAYDNRKADKVGERDSNPRYLLQYT